MMQKLKRQIQGDLGSRVVLSSRYADKKSVREPYLSRGKAYSRFTLPYILPEGTNKNKGGAVNQHGYTGFGAQCVNNLANRLVSNLFPAHQPFFNLEFEQSAQVAMRDQGYDPLQLQNDLANVVEKIHDYESDNGGRVVMVQVMKNLIISGNVCVFAAPKTDKIQAIPLSHYTVTRDSSDNVLEMFFEEKAALNTFEPEIRELIKVNYRGRKQLKDDTELTMLTWVVREDNNSFYVAQTCEDILVNTAQKSSEADLPWLPLRWNAIYGEDYGRGLVEDQAGDFNVLSFLAEAQTKGLVLIADVKYLVKAGATVDIDELATSPTGEFLVGDLDEIGILQLEKYADFTPIATAIADYEKRLGEVFLLWSSVQRNAERVTAEEIRMQAQQLNEAHGGIYTHLSLTLQRPYARLLMERVGLPFDTKVLRPRIVAGMEALAKASDLDKLRVFTETLGMTQQWPQELLSRVDMYLLALKTAGSIGLSLDFVRTNEEQQAIDQQQQQAIMEQNMMAEGSKAIPNIVEGAANQTMGV